MSPDDQEAILTKAREICSRYPEGIIVTAPLVLPNGLGVCLRVPNQAALSSASLQKIVSEIEQIPHVERVLADI